MQQQEMAPARSQRLRIRQARIQVALQRLQSVTYGEWVRCGEQIAVRRLQARPEAPFCVLCEDGRQDR